MYVLKIECTCRWKILDIRRGKYPNESELKLGRVRIMLQTLLLLVPLENMDNLFNRHTFYQRNKSYLYFKLACEISQHPGNVYG